MDYLTTPQLEDLLSHFGAIQVFLQQQASEALQNRSYISVSAGRTQRYSRGIGSELDNLFYHAHSWADTGLQQAYLGGWLGAYKGDPFEVPSAGLAKLSAIREQYRGSLNDLEQYTRRDTTRFLKDMRNLGDEQLGRTAASFDSSLGIKAVEQEVRTQWGLSNRSYKIGDYSEMLTKTANQRAFNAGSLDAAETRGVEVMECSDGSGCGWTSHHDPDKANGKLVSIDEARGNSLAHPACVRVFIERPDLKKKDITKSDALDKIERAALVSAAVVASGLAVASFFDVSEELVDPALAAAYRESSKFGNPFMRTWRSISSQFIPTDRSALAEVLPFYASPSPPEPTALPVAIGDIIRPGAQASLEGQATVQGWGDAVTQWGEAFMDKRITLPELPDQIRNAIHALDSDSENIVREKFMSFSDWVHARRVSSRAADEVSNVINFELRRRQWNDYVILRNWDQLQSAVSATFTKYGPRTRIDLTDFLRGRITLTSKGIRRSITFNPSGPLRSMLALGQDGTLMGALRLVPDSIFRAIIETDEFGKISGNVRLVPKEFPFKVMLRFETPRPKDWQYTGLIPGKDFVDLTARGAARGFSLQDFSFREAFGQLRQMELKDIIFQTDIKTPISAFKLSHELKIPLKDVKDTLERLSFTGLVRQTPDNLWLGIFQWRPSFAAVEELQNTIASTGQKLLGTVSFDKLDLKIAKFLPELKTAAYMDGTKFREVLTSIRLSGFNAIKNASNLEIFSEILKLPQETWDAFKSTLNEVDTRIVLFLRDHGLASPSDISSYFVSRLTELRDTFPTAGNDADVYKGMLDAIHGVSDENVISSARGKRQIIPGGQTHKKWLQVLADLHKGDSEAVVERKIQDLVFFVRSMNLDSPSIMETLDAIDDTTIDLAARQLYNKITRA